MAERKAIRPLKVALIPGTEKLPKVKAELLAKGHEVEVVEGLNEYDLVLGTNAHRLDKFNEKLLTMVIKSARVRVYGTKGNKRVD